MVHIFEDNGYDLVFAGALTEEQLGILRLTASCMDTSQHLTDSNTNEVKIMLANANSEFKSDEIYLVGYHLAVISLKMCPSQI